MLSLRLAICAILTTALWSQTPAAGTLITTKGAAANPANGKVYIVDTSHNSVTIVDTRARTLNKVRVGKAPVSIAVNTLSARVYVANSGDGTLSILDGTTDAIVATIPAGPHPYALAVNSVTGKAYVTNTFSDKVAVIDERSNTATLLKLGSADNVAVDQKTNRIFLLSYEDPDLKILNGATHAITKVHLGTHLWGMAVNQLTGTVYVTQIGSAELWSVEEESLRTASLSVGAFPCAVTVDETRNQIYVINYGDNSASRINGKTGQVTATMKVGAHPQSVAVDTLRNHIYVANTHDNSVTVLDGFDSQTEERLPAGKNPFALAVASDHSVYVANLGPQRYTKLQN